jgi:glycosyltransferase family protein
MYMLSRKDSEYAKSHPMKIMGLEDTLEYIIEHKCSVARYGDGEFNLLSNSSIGFQKNDQVLVKRLREIVKSGNNICLICIPGIFAYENDYEPSTQKFWKKVLVHKREEWYQYCNLDYWYGNADITRCYLEFANRENAGKYFSLLKKIWDKQDVVIVEGALTRLGVGNDLFENAASIQRVLCQPTDAFASYDKIKNFITEQVNKDKLILIALGPAATVLAYDLADCGYWAVDIGNVDKEYEWWLAKATSKQRNPIKFTMEVKGGTLVEECRDQRYLNEIIHRF